MAESVQISRGTLGVLAGSLVLCLMVIAFLLGRQSTPAPTIEASQAQNESREMARAEQPVSASEDVSTETLRSPAVPTSAVPETAPRSKVREAPPREPQSAARPDRENYPTAPPKAPTQAPAPPQVARTAPAEQSNTASAEPRNNSAVQRYFQQIDQQLASGSSLGSLGDPNQFATQALQGSLQGDNSQFEALAATTKSTLNNIRRIEPPAECREHHAMLIKQMQQGLELLEQVQQSTVSLDTSNLTAVAARGQAMQEEVLRFQELDRRLRSGG